MQITKADIVIVGAGIIGSTLALALAKQTSLGGNKKLTIALVERASQTIQNKQPNQRVVALGKLATDLLSEIAVLENLSVDSCYPYQGMFVWDENSDGELAFNANEFDDSRLGYMVDSVECTIALQQEIERNSKIQTFYNAQAKSLSFTDTGARIDLGREVLAAPLIVAADGGSSWVRKQAKIFANHRSYLQHGIVAKIETEHPHKDMAWQRFMSAGPLALLPVNNNQCSIVWSVGSCETKELLSLSDEQFELALQQALDNKLGKVKLKTKPVGFPLVSQQAEKYFARNVVLVGDAAHSIHPLAGQGANLGFKDVRVLVDVLTSEGVLALSDIKLLKKYQDCRKKDNEQVDFLMSTLHHAYQDSLPAWLSLRGFGMNVINQSALLKGWLATQAAGK